MSTSWQDALARAERHPIASDARTDAALEAVQLADAAGDDQGGFVARKALAWAATSTGQHDVTLDAFAWMLARSDDDPERFRSPLWEYKWIVANLPDMAAVPLEQIDAAADDLAARYAAAGASPAPAAKLRLTVCRDTGRHDDLDSLYRQWKEALSSRNRWLNDCTACDISDEVSALASLDRPETALGVVDAMRSDERRCHSQPHWTIARVLPITLRIRGREAALKDLAVAERVLNDDDLDGYSLMLQAYTLLGHHQVAVDLIGSRLRLLHRSRIDQVRFEFLRASRLALRAAADAGTDPGGPYDIPGHGPLAADAFIDWANQQAIWHADRLDARNGNNHFRDRLRTTFAAGFE